MIVTLYSRPGCHLCDEARERILRILEGHGEVELREVDIEADEEMLRAYLERIPVVELDGRVVSELAFDREALGRALNAAPQRTRRRL